MPPMRFTMYGIGGVYNYGCEAIVRGTTRLIRSRWPDAVIRYVSPRVHDDKARLADVEIEVIPRVYYGRYSLRNIARKLASKIGLGWSPILEKFDWLDSTDVVLSIGGDIYTVKPGGKYNKTLLSLGDQAKRSGKKFVVWGASIGPFDDYPQIKAQMFEHLVQADLITSREPVSTAYLESMGVADNVAACADPAFVVEGKLADFDITRSDRPLLGINLSQVVTKYGYPEEDFEISLEKQVLAISKLVEESQVDIALVPHVFSPSNVLDNDFAHLRDVYSRLSEEVKARVTLIDSDIGFLGMKSVLKQCDVVVAARMHCAINALACGVPTLLIGYSQKARGMVKYVYGDFDCYLSIRDFSDSTVNGRVRSMLDKQSEIKKHLSDRLVELQLQAQHGVEALVKVVES